MKNFSNPVARTLMLAMLMVLAGSAAAQQAYPNKPIRFIVPYPPGGSIVILTRLVAQKLTESWGQPVIVDHRPGGSTIIGGEALVKSPPDGYSIIMVATTHIIIPSLIPKIPFDAIKDFAPVTPLTVTELILVLNPGVPANNLQEFIALAKSKPGQLNYASASTGSPTHLAAESFSMIAGVKMQHIPYNGAPPAITNLLGGQVQLFFAAPASVVPLVKSGKLKAFAITGDNRLPALAQVPTFAEAGLSGFEWPTWYGVLAPAATPKAIIDKLSRELARIVVMPDLRETLTSQGLAPFTLTPEAFAARMKADMAKYAKVIKAANIRLD